MTESSAVLVVEQPIPEVKPPPKYRDIVSNDFIALKRGGIDNVPDAENPFWLLARDGMFLHRRNILGRGIVKQEYFPKHLPLLGEKGYFWWKAPNIPADICAQVVDFFRRIYENHKTEAEVILLLNYETNEWAVYVPPQKTSHSSVESAFEPSDIPDKFLIVGSMHSHCNFSAFHSGTDVEDAQDMDGVHLTIGFVDKETPEVVAMVMLNGVRFDYKPEEVADFSNLDAAKAPEEWDEKVIPTATLVSKHMPKGYSDIFDKYGKKIVTPPKTTTVGYTPQAPSSYGVYGGWDRWDDDDYGITDEWWKNYRKEQGYVWRPNTVEQKAKLDSAHWEDYLDDKVIDKILDSNVFTEKDMETVTDNPALAQDINWWRGLFLSRLSETSTLLHNLGMVVEYSVKLKKPDPNEDLLPDDTNKTLADRLEDEGFTVLEVKDDGSVVIDVAKV